MTTARSQLAVDCDTPDDFCVGDPCTVAQELDITVPSCVLDFGTRTLNLNGALRVPNAGVLSLTAGSIAVNSRIRGAHPSTNGDGADVTLLASGNIVIESIIDVSGGSSVGTVIVDAGGNVDVRAPIKARARVSLAPQPGGSVTIEADGLLTNTKRGRVDVRGKRKQTGGGQATLRGAVGVTLQGRVEARGADGGIIIVDSTSGDVSLEEELRAQADPGTGGNVTVSAGGTIAVQATKAEVNADGESSGGSITLAGGGGVTVARKVQARGRGPTAAGGNIVITSMTGDVVLQKQLHAIGNGPGGTIALSTVQGNVIAPVDLEADGDTTGGTVMLSSSQGNVSVEHIRAQGGLVGGVVSLTAAGDVAVAGKIDNDAFDGNGGSVTITTSLGSVVLADNIDLDGEVDGGSLQIISPFGSVDVDNVDVRGRTGAAGIVLVTAAGDVTSGVLAAQGVTVGGEIRLQATAGNLTMVSSFASGAIGGVIEGQASGNLNASGTFSATIGGCIGFSAGGTLNIGAVLADVPLTASCP